MFLGDEFCNPFDENPENFWMKLEHCGRYLYAYDNISPDDIVADIACATGYGSHFLSSKARLVIGCDNKSLYLDYAQHNYNAPNISYTRIDLEQGIDALANRNISKIVCFETLEHTRRPLEVLSGFYRILPRGGEVLLSFPNAKYEKFDENGKNLDTYHLSQIDLEEFVQTARRLGFEIKEVLGQALANDAVSLSDAMQKKYQLSLDNLYSYDRDSIIKHARYYAYPSDKNVLRSYSFVMRLKK